MGSETTHFDAIEEDYLAHVRFERGYAGNTLAAYRGDIADLFRFLERHSVTEPSAITLELLRDWLWEVSERGMATATIARRAASARGVTAWMLPRGLPSPHPPAPPPPPAAPRGGAPGGGVAGRDPPPRPRLAGPGPPTARAACAARAAPGGARHR